MATVIVGGPQPEGYFYLFVHDLNKSFISLHINEHTTVGDVKATILPSVEQGRLVFAGKVLDDGVKLSSFGMLDHTVCLLSRLGCPAIVFAD